MTCKKTSRRRGATILEFTLIGIAMIFVVISFFEMARGMWTYQTLAYAVREATRYTIMHGKDCASPNTCQVTVAQIAGVIQSAGVGLDPDNTTITLTPAVGGATSSTITTMLGTTTIWPPSAASAPGQNITISAVYPFRTILAMFWVGDGRPVKDSQTFNLGATSTEPIQY